ncbi:hypothetical protein AVEN_20367-1 [Araneus ventricosus]|uniref:Uncharacterized protein n=1 Tax=Araneus ventricosus TaxID=182803 RepID=A0A4Y2FVA6_ARAVE|nr:hypothetical protein AVEN_20367-1 [Araneus ventricosus]
MSRQPSSPVLLCLLLIRDEDTQRSKVDGCKELEVSMAYHEVEAAKTVLKRLEIARSIEVERMGTRKKKIEKFDCLLALANLSREGVPDNFSPTRKT